MTTIKSNLIVGKKENISDELLLLNPYQIPVLDLLGGFGSAVTNTQYGWVEDKLQSMKDSITAQVAKGATTVPISSEEIFRVDQVVRIDEELMLITGVTGKNLTVTRGFGETTDSDHAINAEIEIMFNLQDEGSDARKANYIPRRNVFNFTQIFDDTVSISGTAQAVSEYGINDLYMYERAKVQDRLALELENAIVNGVRFQAGDKRMMGGLRHYVKTNVVNGSDSEISFKLIDDTMLKIVKTGGTKSNTRYVLMVSPIQMQKIVLLDDNKVRVTQESNVTGRMVNVFVTPHGRLEIVENINFKDDEVAILDFNRIQVKPLQGREFSHTYLGVTGDNVKGQIIGEYTLEVKQEEAHAWIKGLKTV